VIWFGRHIRTDWINPNISVHTSTSVSAMRSYANTPMFSIGGTYLCRDTRCGKQRHQTTLQDESRDDLFRYRVSTLTEHLPRVVVRHNCSRVQLSDFWWLELHKYVRQHGAIGRVLSVFCRRLPGSTSCRLPGCSITASGQAWPGVNSQWVDHCGYEGI